MMPIYPHHMPDVDALVACEKATILFKHNMGHAYTVVQVRDFRLVVAPFAQHSRGLYFRGTKKGARKPFALAMGDLPTLIVVEGWVDVKIPDEYHPAVTSADTGVTVQRGRAMSCDPIWEHEARAAAQASGKVLFDAHEMGENRAAA